MRLGDQAVLDHTSYSRIRSYLSCSLAFYFRYIAREPPGFVPGALAFGQAFHRALEEALVLRLGGSTPEVEGLITVFDAALEEAGSGIPIRWSEKETPESVRDQARRMITAWLQYPRTGKILAVEEAFEIELAPWLPRLQGRVDFVEELEDALVIGDLKTSRSRWGDDEALQSQDQLVLYREGLRDLIAQVGKPVKLLWEVITKQKSPSVDRIVLDPVPASAERPIKVATLVLEAVERGIFVPSPGWQCSSCPYRSACATW